MEVNYILLNNKGANNRALIGGSIYAGAAIGLGAIARVLVGEALGAFLFSIGLLVVCYFGLTLYTGKICYPSLFSPLNYLVMYGCNFIGAAAMGGLITFTRYGSIATETATQIMLQKSQDSWLSLMALGFLCNCCIYIAVEIFRTHVGVERVIMTMLSIMVFILSGFEHSIANFAYLIMSDEALLEISDVFKVVIAVTVGNTIGGLVMSLGITGYNRTRVR